jgi:hypothetical protein
MIACRAPDSNERLMSEFALNAPKERLSPSVRSA